MQAVCDFVHQHLVFGYAYGCATKTAVDALREGTGVCRDFAHLAIAFCRALNIPARYVSGYLGDIGVPYGGPMDFCAWFEAWLEGRWYAFDARYNMLRIGRLVMVRGRDAADVAMITSFGAAPLTHFEVWCEEVPASVTPAELRAMMRVPELNATAQLTLLRRASTSPFPPLLSVSARGCNSSCQSARNSDPRSASNFDPSRDERRKA